MSTCAHCLSSAPSGSDPGPRGEHRGACSAGRRGGRRRAPCSPRHSSLPKVISEARCLESRHSSWRSRRPSPTLAPTPRSRIPSSTSSWSSPSRGRLRPAGLHDGSYRWWRAAALLLSLGRAVRVQDPLASARQSLFGHPACSPCDRKIALTARRRRAYAPSQMLNPAASRARARGLSRRGRTAVVR